MRVRAFLGELVDVSSQAEYDIVAATKGIEKEL